MKPDQQLEVLRSCVALRVQARAVRESVRVGLASIEQSLAAQVGPLVRKTVAAKLLGCSVQAIDRHVAKGTISVEPIADGATRTAIPTRELLEIAYEQELGSATLADSVAAKTERRARRRDIRDSNQLIIDIHKIASRARKRAS